MTSPCSLIEDSEPDWCHAQHQQSRFWDIRWPFFRMRGLRQISLRVGIMSTSIADHQRGGHGPCQMP